MLAPWASPIRSTYALSLGAPSRCCTDRALCGGSAKRSGSRDQALTHRAEAVAYVRPVGVAAVVVVGVLAIANGAPFGRPCTCGYHGAVTKRSHTVQRQ